MKRVLALWALALAAACSDLPQTPLEPEAPAESRASAPSATTQEAGPDDWIVVFRPGVADAPGLSRRLVTEAGGRLHFTYEHAIQGFSATLPPASLNGIRNNPNVLYVEHDGVATAWTEVGAASWGLDRIDQHSLPLSGTYVYETDGAGVTAYVIDTGIRITHQEIAGRASVGFDAIGDGHNGIDCHGHGTHVSGTIGGNTYGVARGVSLVAVRVLNCQGSGTYDQVIAGVDWATGDHQSRGGPAVANMSLGGPYSQALNDAVAGSVDAGVVYAVAAGNSNFDACYYSPSSEPEALTVGATDSSDHRASFSNYGSCLDLFAPGVGITSSTADSDTSTGTWSGTSMATPHVAGVAALYLGLNPGANPTLVRYEIMTGATSGVVAGGGAGSPNELLYSLITGGGGPTPPAGPTGLAATATSSSDIHLAWADNASDEDGFRLERSLDGSGFSLLATLGTDVKTYDDTGLTAGMTYWYRVQAYNAAGGSGWSNVANATTQGGSPPPESTTAVVWAVSDVDIYKQQGKFVYGLVGVSVVDSPTGDQLAGVTVTGDWYRAGDSSPFRTTSGVTDQFGFVALQSGKANASDLDFCVTSLTGTGITDGTAYPACNPGFNPGEPPPPPPPPGAPSNLEVSYSTKGGGRVELSWTTGGGASVDVYRAHPAESLGFLANTSDNGRYADRGGDHLDSYQVCVVGKGPNDPSSCTGTATVAGGG